jgi:hypothetical protein
MEKTEIENALLTRLIDLFDDDKTYSGQVIRDHFKSLIKSKEGP